MSIAPLSVIALAVPAAAGAAFFLLKCGCWSRCNGSRDSQGCRHHGCFSRAKRQGQVPERWPGCGGSTHSGRPGLEPDGGAGASDAVYQATDTDTRRSPASGAVRR